MEGNEDAGDEITDDDDDCSRKWYFGRRLVTKE